MLNCLLLLLLLSCRMPGGAFEKLHSLRGTWQTHTARGTVYESWSVINNQMMKGKSYGLNGADTILFETIELKQVANEVYYIPTVQDQNEQRPVSFRLISYDSTQFVFENKQHHYPQKITYHFIGSDSLVATIAGIDKGKAKASVFRFSKMN